MITFYGPDGENIENPSDDFIKEFTNKEADYWQQGSGDSSFEADNCDEALIIFYEEPYGFLILRHPDYLVPYDEDKDNESVEHDVGGEPMVVPACSFVSREDAYKIITEYVKKQKFAKKYNWTDLYEIDFEGNEY